MNLIIPIADLLDALVVVVDGRRAQLDNIRQRALRAKGDAALVDTRLRHLEAAYEWLIEQDEVRLTLEGAVIIPSDSTDGVNYHVSSRECQCTHFYYQRSCSHMDRADVVRAALFVQCDIARRSHFHIFRATKRKSFPKPVVEFLCVRRSVAPVAPSRSAPPAEWATAQREADELFA